MKSAGLISKRIPESRPHVEEIGAAWIAFVDGINAACKIHGEHHGFGHGRGPESQAWAGFDVVRPILMQPVSREVVAPVNLRLNSAQERFRRGKGVSRTI